MPDPVVSGNPPVASPGEPAFVELSRLMVVAIDSTSGALQQIAQTAPNGPWAIGWTPIAAGSFVIFASGLTRDGRVAIVAQPSGGNTLDFICESAGQTGPESWDAPVSLGAPPGATGYSSLAMARDVDGRIEIFAIGMDGSIWWIYQNPDQIVDRQVTVTPPGTNTPIVVTVQEQMAPATPWSSWIQLPGGLSTIVARRQGDGRVALFGINSGLHLYRCVQSVTTAVSASDWSPWIQIDSNFTGLVTQVSAIVGPEGSLHCFALTQRAQIVHTMQMPAGSDTWTSWTTTGFSRNGFAALASSLDGDGHLFLTACDQSKVLSFNAQTDAGSRSWSGWRDFASSDYPVALALDYNADGRLSLFSHWLLPASIGIGGLWTIAQAAIDSTEWEISWQSLAPGQIKQFQVVRDLTPPA